QRQRWAQAAAPPAAPATPPSAAPATQPAAAPPPTPAPAADVDAQLAQLTQLGQLRDAGVLTEAEFEAKKALILGG
ncbi:SHOCT domain-containing protein, partial [Desertimonas flava]